MRYGLIGEKLGHSLSAKIYNKCGIEYELCEISENELESFVDNKTLTNFNVTIPYKKSIMPLLDFISDEAREIGAVNTVYNKDGKWYGENTDIYGMEFAFDKAGLELENKNVLILGTGGTSNTAAYLCKKKGAAKITKVSRTGEVNYTNVYDLVDTNVIINATPVGMYPNNFNLVIDLEKFKNLTGVFDCIYNPIRTSLIVQAMNLKIKCSGGLYMLVAQAIKSMSIFNNKEVDIKLIDKIHKELLLEQTNIVLIGMASCGKSTIGEMVAKKLNKRFSDIDKQFFRYFRLSPENEIMFNGEASFRKKETTVVKRLNFGGQVIATGGGTILLKENVDMLRQNGVLVHIDRDVDKLVDDGRPLSKQRGAKELYKLRKPLYEEYGDYMVLNDNLDVAVKEVIDGYEKNIGDKWC